MRDKRGLIFACLLMVFLSSGVLAVDDLIALQGNVYNSSGDALSSGNLIVSIYDAMSSGNLIYNSTTDFNNKIVGGQYDVMIGNGSNDLTLEFGKLYYLELFVNNEPFTFNGSSRQIFQSSVGQINSSYVNSNQINAAHLERNIDLVNATNIQSSAVNNTGTNWAGQFLSAILDDLFDRITSVNNTGNLQNILNSTGIYSTYNATYAGLVTDNSSWNQSYANDLYVDIGGDTMAGNLSIGTSNSILYTTDLSFNNGSDRRLDLEEDVVAYNAFKVIDTYTNDNDLFVVDSEDGIIEFYLNTTFINSSDDNTLYFYPKNGNITSLGKICDSVGCIGSGSSGGGLWATNGTSVYNSTALGFGIGTNLTNWTGDIRGSYAGLGLYDTTDGGYTIFRSHSGDSYVLTAPTGKFSIGEIASYSSGLHPTEWFNFTSTGINADNVNITASYFKGDGSLLTGISSGGSAPVWLNTSNYIYINSSYSTNISMKTNNSILYDDELYFSTETNTKSFMIKGASTTFYNEFIIQDVPDGNDWFGVDDAGIFSLVDMVFENSTDDVTLTFYKETGNINSLGSLTSFGALEVMDGDFGVDDAGVWSVLDMEFENIAEDVTITLSKETGNITATGKICDSVGCIGSGSSGSGLFATNGTSIYNSTASQFGFGTATPSYFVHAMLGAEDRFYIDGITTPHTDTNGVLGIDLQTTTADVKGIFVNTMLGADDLDGVIGIYSSVSGFLDGHNNGKENYAFKASMTGDNDDTDQIYIGYSAGDFASGGGAAESIAFTLGSGYDYALDSSSGDIMFWAYSPTITADNDEGAGDGQNITILAGDAYSDGDGGNLILSGGNLANTGVDGNVILGYDGSSAVGKVVIKTDLNMTSNNVTSVDCIVFASGGKICSGA